MKIKTVLFLNVIVSLFVSCRDVDDAGISDYTQFVNPFIGTQADGHLFPGATVPMGLIQLSPRTGNYASKYMSGYQYEDSTLKGFSHTHLSGGGNPNLGDVLMLPFSDNDIFTEGKLYFSKEDEKASPGYYSTLLTDSEILVELSTTTRTGIHRYTFKNGGNYNLLINIDDVLYRGQPENTPVKEAWFEIENDTTINGYLRSFVDNVNRKVYFTIRLSNPIVDSRYLDELNRKLVINFKVEAQEQLIARVAISGVSIDGAKASLEEESLGKSFDAIWGDAVNKWNLYLSKISVEGSTEKKINFYTSLYHLFIQPNIISDVDGRYRGADDSIYVGGSKEMYSTFANWDIYRGAFPLYTILIPNKIETFVASILRHYDEKGNLAVWSLWGQDAKTMVGNHSVSMIVEAYLKGFNGIDEEKTFKAIEATLTQNWWKKYNWSLYDKYGYLPSDTVPFESVSRTLEATYNDWCAAQLAKKLGKTAEYDFFSKRSDYYKNLFDTSTLFMRGRNMDGSWVEPFDPVQVTGSRGTGDFTEGNAWHYLWHVQHDIPGLISLMGGINQFEARLDTFFNMSSDVAGEKTFTSWYAPDDMIGQYAHFNEPCHHVIYLYNYTENPHKAQKLIHDVINNFYKNTPEGLIGNDDFGQMSAWYVLSSLGFYPIHPASGIFDIGSPSFKHASINLENGKTFAIKAPRLSAENIYVKSVILNREPINNYRITYEQIMSGGTLEFEMVASPSERKIKYE